MGLSPSAPCRSAHRFSGCKSLSLPTVVPSSYRGWWASSPRLRGSMTPFGLPKDVRQALDRPLSRTLGLPASALRAPGPESLEPACGVPVSSGQAQLLPHTLLSILGSDCSPAHDVHGRKRGHVQQAAGCRRAQPSPAGTASCPAWPGPCGPPSVKLPKHNRF